MKPRVMLALGASFVLFAAALPAGDETTIPMTEKDKAAAKEDTKMVDYSRIAQAGPGIYKVEMDKQGRIASCIVVGVSRISTVLGAAKGKAVARERAELRAKGEFVKWLKEKVSVHQRSDDETIIFLEGNEDNDKDSLRESGKTVEKTTAAFSTTAEGVARGLQVVHVEINGKEKEYTVVLKWKAKTAAAVKSVKNALDSDTEEDGPKSNKGSAKASKKSKSDNKKIRDKKITIDDN